MALLKLDPFVPNSLRTITDANRLEVGRLLTKDRLLELPFARTRRAAPQSCRTNFIGSSDADLIAAFLRGPLRHGAQPYMPRIDLPDDEITAIADYIASVNAARQPANAAHLAAKE